MVNILGVPIYDDNLHSAVSTVVQFSQLKDAKSKFPKCISATSAHGLVYAKKEKSFKNILNNFYLNLPDGMPTVWIGKLKGAKKMERCYGPDFFREVIIASKDKDIKHYFCGGKNGVVENLKEACEEHYSNHNVAGIFSPPFREMTDGELEELSDKITKCNIDVVWIGMSTPKQELFAYRLSRYAKVHFICTVGAAFDFHTGRIKQAQKFIRKLGMEWLFRLIIEPKRLWKRYFTVVPLFMYYNICEFFKKEFFTYKNIE